MKNFDEYIGGVNFMVVGSEALIVVGDYEERIAVDDVLKLAEFAAAAYEALTGAPYEHKEVGPNGIETKPGYAVGGVVNGGGPVAGGLAAGVAPQVSFSPGTVDVMRASVFAGMRFPQMRLERGA